MGWTAEHDLECVDCGHIFTVSIPIAKAGKGHWPQCPQCGGEARKVLKANQIRYVGPGFEQTRRVVKDNIENKQPAYEPQN